MCTSKRVRNSDQMFVYRGIDSVYIVTAADLSPFRCTHCSKFVLLYYCAPVKNVGEKIVPPLQLSLS